MTTRELFSQNPVVPVVTLDSARDAPALASALAEGGIDIVEIALRTTAAIDGITTIRERLPTMIVGAGTVRTPMDIERLEDAGAAFAVTPGTTEALLEAASHREIPLVPGAMTPSEIMKLADEGFHVMKLFPAGNLGGIDYVRALAGPFPDIGFVPSGGVGSENFIDYLRLPSIVSVSGTWIAPAEAIEARDWERITRIARTVRGKLDAR